MSSAIWALQLKCLIKADQSYGRRPQTSNETWKTCERLIRNWLTNSISKGKHLHPFGGPNETLSEADAQFHRHSAERWEELVGQIRQLPHFHHFHLPPPISTRRKVAAEG